MQSSMSEGKTKRNKKIKHTIPGESTRTYKNKPQEERIGSRNQNGSKKVFQNYIRCKRDTRNGEGGLRNMTLNANRNPIDDWYPKPVINNTNRDVYRRCTSHSLYKKMIRLTPRNGTAYGFTHETYGYMSPCGKFWIIKTDTIPNDMVLEKLQ